MHDGLAPKHKDMLSKLVFHGRGSRGACVCDGRCRGNGQQRGCQGGEKASGHHRGAPFDQGGIRSAGTL
jgi:hypothetical protein